MIPDKEKLFAELEVAGETLVRERKAQGVYAGRQKLSLIEEWLRQKEENRNQEKSDLETSFKREEISEAKEANRLASEANAVALSASREASESTRMARHNRNIAIAALIISIVSAIISLCKK